MQKILAGLSEFAGISAQKYLKKERHFGDIAIAPDETLCSDNLNLLTMHFPCDGMFGLMSIIDKTYIFEGDYQGIVLEMRYDGVNVDINQEFYFLVDEGSKGVDKG